MTRIHLGGKKWQTLFGIRVSFVLREGMIVDVTSGPFRGVKGRLVREARHAPLVEALR
jgi:hypothetical protein